MKTIPFTLALAATLTTGVSFAGTTVVENGPQSAMVATTTSDGWQFTLGLYGWGAGLSGDIGAAGYTSNVDISFSDILDTLDMVAMGMAEVRKDRWMFQFEGFYLKNSLAESAYLASAGTTLKAKIVSETTRLEPVVGYRIVDTDRTHLDLLGGIVYYDISNELSLNASGKTIRPKSSDNWVDPIIGVRLDQHFDDRWSVLLRGDVGGFGVSADIVWQVSALIGYDFNESTSVYFGYRHAAVDYQNGGFLYDAAASGPLLGLAIKW